MLELIAYMLRPHLDVSIVAALYELYQNRRGEPLEGKRIGADVYLQDINP